MQTGGGRKYGKREGEMRKGGKRGSGEKGERNFVGRLEEEVVGGMREEEIITPSSFAHATKGVFFGGVKGVGYLK